MRASHLNSRNTFEFAFKHHAVVGSANCSKILDHFGCLLALTNGTRILSSILTVHLLGLADDVGLDSQGVFRNLCRN